MTLTEFLEKHPANSCKRFGEFVRKKREEKGLSVRAFANELGISAVYLGDIENCHRPAPRKILPVLKEKLNIQKDEEEIFYEMVALTRETVEPEIIRYLIENLNARKAIKIAIDKNISGDQLYDAVSKSNVKGKMNLENSKRNNEFSQFIHNRRLQLGKTMDETSLELGISKTYYFDIEKGQRNFPIELLDKLIMVLDVSDDEKQDFIDFAYKSRGVCAPDIIEFVNANPEARNLIRKMINNNTSTKQLLEIVQNQEENLNLE